jgi:hypothetical protein
VPVKEQFLGMLAIPRTAILGYQDVFLSHPILQNFKNVQTTLRARYE